MGRLGNFLYNLDRAVASLGGAPPQETISSEVGRVARGQAEGHWRWETWAAKKLSNWLDTTPRIWGKDHTQHAIEHADALDRVDDGREQ